MIRSIKYSFVHLAGMAGALALWTTASAQVPFTLQAPGLNADHYRMTTFANALGFPVGMAELPDGSLLVAESLDGGFLQTKRGVLTRLADTDNDGIADQRSELTAISFGLLTTLRVVDDYVFVTGQARPLEVFRLGVQPTDALQHVGQLGIHYPAGWYHPHSELVVERTGDESFDVYLQVGSDANYGKTVNTTTIDDGAGSTIPMAGESIQRVSLSVANASLHVQGVTQIAAGLRNAAGMAFDPATGDLYIAENGIDGFVNANEPTSADELNVVRASDLGSEVIDFGFPQRYVEYRTGQIVGADQPGVDPLIAFQPLGDPLTGDESEGPNQLAFLPDSFPTPLHGGMVVTMHGRFATGGLQNEENPLVFVGADRQSYLHLIGNEEKNVGHLDGVLSTADSLYIADVSPAGGLANAQGQSGAIYQIKSRYPSIDGLAEAIRQVSADPQFDVNGDQQIDADDFGSLIRDIYQTSFGDANLDGQFNSSDLVEVFAGGKYEHAELSARWADGDWNGNGTFGSDDLVTAFQGGGYVTGAVRNDATTPSVPEPGLNCLCLALGGLLRRRSAHG